MFKVFMITYPLSFITGMQQCDVCKGIFTDQCSLWGQKITGVEDADDIRDEFDNLLKQEI